jgi:pSer/pThr/pTyr-binding forkhead associated (FHA) protein
VDAALIPEGGVGVYIAGSFKPQYLRMDTELIIGRNTDNSPETFLDLIDLDAFNMGISRRHAVIRRAGSGFEVVDLSSTNGTWLNAERLVPNRPYPLASGSQLRLGRVRLFVIYNSKLKGTKKK